MNTVCVRVRKVFNNRSCIRYSDNKFNGNRAIRKEIQLSFQIMVELKSQIGYRYELAKINDSIL